MKFKFDSNLRHPYCPISPLCITVHYKRYFHVYQINCLLYKCSHQASSSLMDALPTHAHFCTSLIVFSPFGVLVLGALRSTEFTS